MAQEDFNPLDPYSELPAPVAPEMDLGAYMPEPYTPKARGHRGPVSHAVNADLPPEARALLDTIAMDEAPGYDVMYGGRRFDDYSQHPGVYTPIQSGPNKGKKSSAAGRYQFLKSTWDAQAAKLGLQDFSPESQDAAAWDLAQSRYGDKTGRDLLADLRTGDPRFQQGISNALSSIWTSMPGGIEQRSKADKFLNRYAESLAQHGGEMAPQGPQGETYDIPLSNGQTLTVPKGVPREQAINDLRAQGMDVMGVTTYELTNDKKLTLPENVNIADALADLQKQFPDQEWMTKAHAEKTGFGPAAKAAVLGLGPMAQQGVGEILQEFDATKNLGDEWRAQALKKREEINKGVEEPLPTDPLSTRFAHGAGSVIGGAVPAVALTPLAMMGPAGAAAAALAGIPLAAGSLGQRYAEQQTPKDMDLSDPSNLAVVGTEAIGQALPIAANPVGKTLLQNIGRGVASNVAVDVPSVALERAAVGQDVLSKDAAEEYLMAAAGDVVGGGLGGAGAHYFANRGRTPGEVPGELPPEQAALSESLAPTEGPAETIEDLEAQARGGEEFFRKAQEAAPMEPAPGEIPEPTVRGREQPIPPMGEMPPEEVIPEPTVREEAPPAEAPPEPHFAQSILGLKPNGALSKRLSQYDLNNLEHHGAIEEEINKSPTNIPAENLNALEARMKEIIDASQIESTTPPDGGGIKQPQVGEAEGYPPVGGEGIPPSDQVGKKATGKGKVPEEIEAKLASLHHTDMENILREVNPELAKKIPADNALYPGDEARVEAINAQKLAGEPKETPRRLKDSNEYRNGMQALLRRENPEAIKAAMVKLGLTEQEKPLSREEFAQRIGAEAPPTGKIKAVHNPELAKATQAGDTVGVLNALSKSSNPIIAHIGEKAKNRNILRILANDQQLADAIPVQSWPPRRGEIYIPLNVAGLYRGALGDILVKERNAGNEHVVGHEVAHAIVIDAVDAPTPEQMPHVNALKSLHKYVKNLPEFKNVVLKTDKKTGETKPKIKKEYGVSDIQEFIAEGLSNPDFQHRLSQIKYQNTTAWGRFTGAVAKILGLKNDNAFAEFLSHTEQLIDKIQPTREAAEPKVRFAEEKEPRTQKWFKPKFTEKTEVYRGEKPAGVEMLAGGYHPENGVAWLETVKAKNKGEGAGRSAVETFENWAKERGANVIHAEALPSSLGFWKRMGYDIAGKPRANNRVPIRKEVKLLTEGYDEYGRELPSEQIEPTTRFMEEEHPTTDSTGQRIHPTDEGVKNFWKWFGDSRMFDGERKPLRLYHGTRAPGGFDVFDRTKSPHKGTINEVGSWFTENPEIANTFAGASERVVSAGWEPTGQSVVPVYARIEKPLYIDSVDELASLWKKHAGGDETLKNGNADQFRTWLKDEAGYDGIIMSASDIDPSFKDGLYVLALDPDIQIKSAIGNVGEFDTTKKGTRFMEEEPDHQRYSDEAIEFANKQNWFEKFYTPIRQSLVSAKAPLESLLSKLPLYDENNEVRSAVKLAQATRDSQIISNGLEHGFLHRNAQGVIEAVFDPRLAPGNLRKRMMQLPEEARGKFAEAMTTLAQAGHNLRGVEMKAIMDDAQQKISIGQAYLDRVASNYEKAKGKLEAAQELSRRMGNTQAKEMVAKAKEDLAVAKAAYTSPDYAAGKKHVAAQQSLLKAVREQFHKAKRDEGGKIYDISKEQEQAAKDFLNSSPEVRQLASDVRELLTNNAKLLKDAQVISKETYKKFTDDKYNYAPLYMSIEDLDTALPAAKMYMQGEQRKVMTVKGLKGSQHEVNFFQNILTHQARVGAMALHNNARLGALHDLEALGHAEKMPGNATPTIKQQAVAVMEDGKRHYYLVKDRPLYEAFEINRKLPLPEFMTDVTRNFSKLQLVNPKYWYNQILREPFMATMTSRAGIITPAHAGKELASLVFSALTKQDTNAAKIYRELKSQGVTGSHEYLRDLVKEKGTLTETSGAKAVAKNATEFASTIHEYVDAATKIAVMRKAIAKAKSGKLTGTPILDEKAARDAAIAHVGDMLNFYNRGHSNTAKFIVQTTPFFNSWAQGMDSLVRNATGYGMSEHEAKQARQMFVAHAAALMAFSAAITAFRCMYSEDYRNAKPDDWAANWLIPMPEELQDKKGRMFKAKGPFELSTLFKLGPEIAVRRAFGLDHGKDTGKIVSDSAWRDLAPPGAEAGFMPFILKGAVETAIGREIDIRPIISGKESRKLWNADIVPMLRGKGESPIADALAFGDLSPAAVRHLGQSYFGEMFTALDAVAKGAASTFGSKTARADLRDITEKAPWVNAIITNPDKLDMATGYDFAEEQALNRNSLRYAKKHGIELTPEEKAELKESGRYGKQATRIKDSIAKINKSMDKLKNDPDYTDAMQAEYEAKNQRLIEKKRKKLEKLEALKTKAEE